MHTLTLDFETYYARGYSLRGQKYTTLEYIRDPQFHVHGLAAKWDDQPGFWISGNEVSAFLTDIDWSEAEVVGHNWLFDGLILSEHYATYPERICDTLSLARGALTGHLQRFDLDSVAKLLGIGGKIDGLADTMGVRDLSPELEGELAKYAINDVDITYAVYAKLAPLFPSVERDLIHLTARMSTQPKLYIDVERAEKALAGFISEREAAISNSGLSKTQLSSNQQFAAHIESLGLTTPTKINAKGKETPALAKGDLELLELMSEHPEHQALWTGRLAAKSTINVTRTERLIKTGTTGTRRIPLALSYYGAHTGRWSGGAGTRLNPQNLPRGGEQRKCIIAPPGHVIVVADSAQIELRVNAWLAGQQDSLDILRAGGDIYCHTASKYFGREITKADKHERQFGKLLCLGLGYGLGWQKLQNQCAVGMMGADPIQLSDNEAMNAVNTYRKTNWAIKRLWQFMQNMLPALTDPDCDSEYKCLHFIQEAIVLPNGMSIHYPDLHPTELGEWLYGTNEKPKYIYGPKMVENCVQAIARIVVAEQMLEIDRHPDIHVVSMTHDEVIAIAPNTKADNALAFMIEVMSQSPTWACELPCQAEGGYDTMYSK